MEDIKIVYQGVEYYRSKKLADMLGYNTPVSMLLKGTKFADGRIGNRKKVSEENVLYLPYSLNNVYGFSIRAKGEWFLTKEGVIEFITNSQNCSLKEKNEVCEKLGLKLKVLPQTFTEVEFRSRLQDCLDMVNESLKDFGYNFTMEKQKRILEGKYRVDFFIPECNLCIEWDEMSTHWNKTEEDKQREKEIKEVIKGAKFIRIHQYEGDWGINAIVNFLYRYVFINRKGA